MIDRLSGLVSDPFDLTNEGARLESPRFSSLFACAGSAVSCSDPVTVRKEPQKEKSHVQDECKPNAGSNRHEDMYAFKSGKRSVTAAICVKVSMPRISELQQGDEEVNIFGE